MSVEHIKDEAFESGVVKSDLPVLVDFWADWCGPCKALAPKIEELSNEFDGKIKFTKMNVDENRDTPVKYNIMGIPTLILFKNGEAVDKLVGNHTKESIKELLEKAL
jgi:thioredoxin 1